MIDYKKSSLRRLEGRKITGVLFIYNKVNKQKIIYDIVSWGTVYEKEEK